MKEAEVIAFELINLLKEKGSECYLTGGTARDYLLGIDFLDIDIASNQPPSFNCQIVTSYEKLDKKGYSYGALKYIYKGFAVDITTLRKESEYIKYRRPKNITFISSIKEDSDRRDFTINALYIDCDKQIHDFHQGLLHLKQKRIVMIGDVKARIHEDAIRILRAVRLSLKLDFELDAELEKIIIENHFLLSYLKKEVIEREIAKIKQDCDIIKITKKFKELNMYTYLEETK